MFGKIPEIKMQRMRIRDGQETPPDQWANDYHSKDFLKPWLKSPLADHSPDRRDAALARFEREEKQAIAKEERKAAKEEERRARKAEGKGGIGSFFG